MALFDMKKLAVVLALAVSVGACAQKSVRLETPKSSSELQAELEILREQRAELEKKEVTLREQMPLQTEELVKVRAEQIRLNGRETVILSQLESMGDSATRQARRQLQREANVMARQDKYIAKAVRDAAIQGCPPGSVRVKAYGQNLDLFALFPPTVVIRVTNNTNAPVAISTPFKGLGWVAENLCPGGSMNVSFKLDSHDSIQAQFPVIVSTMAGEFHEESRSFYLDKNMANYQRVRYESWLFGNR